MLNYPEKTTNDNVLLLRPHHLSTFITFLYPGPGLFYKIERTYGKDWMDKVKEIFSQVKLKNLRVRLVQETDFMCDICPYRRRNTPCNADLSDIDTLTMKMLDLKYGDEYSIEDIEKMNISDF